MILKLYPPNACYVLRSRAFLVKLLSSEYEWTHVIIGQYWLMKWFGAVKQQAISRVNNDDICVAIWHHQGTMC